MKDWIEIDDTNWEDIMNKITKRREKELGVSYIKSSSSTYIDDYISYLDGMTEEEFRNLILDVSRKFRRVSLIIKAKLNEI